MGSALASVKGVLSGADRLEGEEQQHADAGRQEEDAATNTLDSEGSTDGPEQVPDGEDTKENRSNQKAARQN